MPAVPYNPGDNAAPTAPLSGAVPYSGDSFDPTTPQPQQDQSPNAYDTATHMFGQLARLPVQGVMGTGLMAADALTGLNNLGRKAARAAGLSNAPDDQMPSDTVNSHLDAIFGKPEGFTQKVTNVLGSGIAGGYVDPVLKLLNAGTQALVPSRFTSSDQIQPAIDQTTEALQRQGFKFAPDQMNGGPITRAMQWFGGNKDLNANLSVQNEGQVQRLAADAVGLPQSQSRNITQEVLHNNGQNIIQRTYGPIEAIHNINIAPNTQAGANFRAAVNAVDRAPTPGTINPLPEENAVSNLVDQTLNIRNNLGLNLPVSNLSGQDAINRIRNLYSTATSDFRNNQPMLGNAKRAIARAYEQAIEDHLQSVGTPNAQEMLTNFQSGRVAYAKNSALSDMLVDQNTGLVNPGKAFQRMQGTNANLTDELATIAQAGSPVYSKVMQPNAKPAGWMHDSTLLGLAGAMHMLGMGNGPTITAALAAPARAGARAMLGSNAMQNYMAQRLIPSAGIFGQAPLAASVPIQAGLFGENQ